MKISGLIKTISENEKSPIVIELLEIIQQQADRICRKNKIFSLAELMELKAFESTG